MGKRFSPPPFTFDDKKLIGTGAFGEVYFGRLTESKTPVCVKVCKGVSVGSFEAEFDLLSRLKGRNSIIQTYGFFQNSFMRCIVLEQAKGSLEQLLTLPRHSAGLLMNTVLTLVGNLGNALMVLFKEKIAHRDIKPMNILYFTDNSTSLKEQYTFKLGDFGSSSTVIGPEESVETYAGTWPYMAPQELARYLKSEDRLTMNAEKTDLWSLGVTLFRCCTSKLPFDAPSAQRQLRIIQNRPENAISFSNNDGKYYNGVNGYHYQKWLNRSIGTLIQMLFQQANIETVAEIMLDLSKLSPRVAYYLNEFEFHEVHPRLWKNDPWQTKKSWIQYRSPRESLNDITEDFLILWDFTRPIVNTGTELYISYEDYSKFEEMSTLSTEQSSAYILKFISILQSKVSNAFVLAETSIELAECLDMKDIKVRKREARRHFHESTENIQSFFESLAYIDDLRKDPTTEELRKKKLVALAKCVFRENQAQKQLQLRQREILHPLLYKILSSQCGRKLVHDLQPMLWNIMHRNGKELGTKTSSNIAHKTVLTTTNPPLDEILMKREPVEDDLEDLNSNANDLILNFTRL